MKKEIILHFLYALLFLLIYSLLKGYLSLSYWPLWIGVIVGTILPNVDHLIYVYLIKPEELTSQRVTYLNQERNFPKAMEILAESKYERHNPVLHTAFFQVLFLIVTFLILSSSSSLLGRGIVIAFSLHLLVDQFQDYKSTKTLSQWFSNTNFSVDEKFSKYYFIAVVVVFLFVSLIV